ncbi:hypothetical protein [Cloacibacillus evryensis]|uniref:hypothetical protein n=1 Tax=Cloacibacillus evryensis TaxID=508460 RepID=UPI0005570BD6|nr:hypothetical protein [Cloacibacillus evryensis]
MQIYTIAKNVLGALGGKVKVPVLDAELKLPAECMRIVGACADGAIIEEGANANGSWIKYANGTMECYGVLGVELTLTVYGNIYEGSVWIPYPAQYVNDNVVNIASVQFPTQSAWCSCLAKSSNQLIVRVLDIAARSGTFLIQWRSIGRWK